MKRLSPCILFSVTILATLFVSPIYGPNDTPVVDYHHSSSYSCADRFSCERDFTPGSGHSGSIRLSTSTYAVGSWSSMIGGEIAVTGGKDYRVSTNMKLNNWATQSHISIEGFNNTSDQWYLLIQCPGGVNGPVGWQEWNCRIRVPNDVIKLRPIVNAGWSSRVGELATTWVDAITITALNNCRICDGQIK